jgi:DNA processing protein
VLASEVLHPDDPRPAVREAVRDWLAFQCVAAFVPEAAVEALRATRDPRRALRVLQPGCDEAAPDLAPSIAALTRAGAYLVPFTSPGYPWRLARLRDPAPVLAVVGDAAVLRAPAVAIVGARAASVYGTGVARRLASDLARSGLVVVSGLARGIDAAAHEGALEAGGSTVAVQACGPDRVYPAAHRALAARIAAQGAVITELPPGTPPRPAHFPLRNRLIAGLARALVVVEARLRSGSLVSARHALDQGIDVLAVPGPVNAPTSAGPNQLLRDGATPALDAADVLAALGFAAEPTPGRRRPPLAGGLREIVSALERQPASKDELARALGRKPQELAPDLLELELDARVALDRDGRWRVIP